MNKIQQKRVDFQKLRQTTRRIERLVRAAKTVSPEQLLKLISAEINLVEEVIPTVENSIVKERLLGMKETLEIKHKEFNAYV